MGWEIGGSQVHSQPGLWSEPLSQKVNQAVDVVPVSVCSSNIHSVLGCNPRRGRRQKMAEMEGVGVS